MKKRLSLLIAFVMLLAVVLPTIAACDKDKVVEKIEVVDPKTEFILGQDNTIDYDNLNLKVTYADDSDPVTKTVKQWGATYTEANLKVEGTSSYTVSYGGQTTSVTVTVKVANNTTSEKVTVTYKYLDGSTPDTQSEITKGNKAALSTPSRDNYNFDGWYTKDGTTNNDWGNKWNADDPVNEDLTLYAKWTKNITTYIVTFDDGTTTETKTVNAGETVTFPTEPTKDRFDFGGWWTKNNGDWDKQWQESDSVTGNITLYAKWIDKNYTQFTFDYLDGTAHTTDTTAEVERGQSLGSKLPTPAQRDNYRFDGWYTQNGTSTGEWGTKWEATTETTADQASVSLFAKWTRTKATVIFNYNWPAGAGATPQATTVELILGDADKLTLAGKLPSTADKTPDHYKFANWSTSVQGGEAVTEATVVTDDVTYYAHWTRNTVNVKFEYADSKTDAKQFIIDEGSTLGDQFPSNPTREGYRFDGWKDAQSRVYNRDSVIDHDTTITAQWVQLVTVKFDLNYDNAVNNIQDVVLDINTSLGTKLPSNLTRADSSTKKYAFAGWFDNKDSGTRYDGSTIIDSDKTLYAHWTETEILYTVTYHGNGGYFADYAETTTSQVAAQQAISSHPECARDGYELEGWYTDANCQTKYNNEPITQNTELHAKWEQKIAVFFHWGFQVGGEDKITHQYFGKTETSITFNLDTPTYEGHKFLGWFDQESGGTRKGDSGASVTLTVNGETSFHYYAQWETTLVKVTYDYQAKGESHSETIPWGSDLELTHVPTVEGKTFDGWYTDGACSKGNLVTKLTDIKADTTVYAKWANTVTLVLVLGSGQDNIAVELPAGAQLINKLVYTLMRPSLVEGAGGEFMYNMGVIPNMKDALWPNYQLAYYAPTAEEKSQYGLTGDFITDVKKLGRDVGNATKLLKFVFKIEKQSPTNNALCDVTPERFGYTFGETKNVAGAITTLVDWEHTGGGPSLPWPVFGKKEPADTDLMSGVDIRFNINSTTWLYAQWTATDAQKYNVTLHYNDGTENKYEIQVYSGSTLALPGPARNGYTFDGWYKGTGDAIGDIKWTDDMTVTEELHLWAKWTEAKASFVVTLNNGVETKSFTVESGQSLKAAAEKDSELKEFLATANTWLNGSEVFALTTPVSTNLTLVAQSESNLSGVVLSFSAPDSYLNYRQRSTTTGDSLGYYKLTGEQAAPYEVGTVNKFIFRPSVRLRTAQGTVTDYNPTTTAKVYVSDTKGGNYSLLNNNYTASNNTYKFDESLAGKYIKLEISLSGSNYTIPSSIQNKVVAEFVLVKGGYNVYDQRGLSVMNDLQKIVWAPLWGVGTTIVKDTTLSSRESKYQYKVEFTDVQNAVQLAADDLPLYKYVGNVDTVILHNDLDLDPTQMPQDFFWQAGDERYYSAYQSLAGWSHQQELLVGSLKDGDNSGSGDLSNYMPMYDRSPDDQWAVIDLGFTVNMQKGFYSTAKVSVFGNYFSLTHILERGGRRLQNYVDWDNDTKVGDPVPHWSVFQLMTNKNKDADPNTRGNADNPFTIKNIAMKGSTPQRDYYDQGKTIYFAPAGIMLANTYSSIKFDNVNANNFFVNITGDNYGESEDFKTSYQLSNSKLYDAYSNMIYTWRGHIDVKNSELVGSGGPLFILCDGLNTDNNTNGADIMNGTDDGGPTLTVDQASRLEAYATGAESWYDANSATALVTMMRGQVETLFNGVGKTLRWVKDGDRMRPYKDDDSDKNQYVNVIAALICSPGNLISGLNNEKIDVRSTAEIGQSNEYKLHNSYVKTVRQLTQKNGTNFLLLAQMGSLWLATDQQGLINPDGIQQYYGTVQSQGKEAARTASWGTTQAMQASAGQWMQASAATYSNKVCIYLSAGSLSGSANAPYFGVILDIGDYSKVG